MLVRDFSGRDNVGDLSREELVDMAAELVNERGELLCSTVVHRVEVKDELRERTQELLSPDLLLALSPSDLGSELFHRLANGPVRLD